MMPVHRLTDDDLLEVGNRLSLDLSYHVAGWDYTNISDEEKAAERRCERQSRIIGREMERRGLRTTVTTLCPLGVAA